ncbi:MAG TPA: hypothetical protein VFA37_04285 [Gaiellaceae bacterium]|nr:hypothetical protein [Gaiellaceae bacterium]
MTLSGWLRVGWSALAADAGYWIWEGRQPEEQRLSGWHADLNIVLYFGGGILFVVLLLAGYLVWRARQPGQTETNSTSGPG